jgi:2-phospho-L-lactate guanylyltransferase
MKVWAIIPVKPLNRAKSRLSDVLTPEERQRLAERMLRHMLEVIQAVPQIIGTLVISRDNKVLAIAREYNALTVQESGSPELNKALTRATQVVSTWRADSVIILPADLPLIQPEDISQMIHKGQQRGVSVVIATDHQQDGTNALFIRPPGVIPYAFGQNSFTTHCEMAREADINLYIYESERVSLDIDLPEDLEYYRQLASEMDLALLDLIAPE